ncbi:MAG: Crp/Fnr family transcriptional regulator [Flavipsychrobacter sp.]|nr:Crp/Fnr family transcriptional regulator [Flavipsychrobacter sp.]
MFLHLKDRFPQLDKYWDKYLSLQRRLELPARSILLQEGKVSKKYFFIEKGCARVWFNNNGRDITVQFFFENEGLSSIDSFRKNIPSTFTIETIEPSIVYEIDKKYIDELVQELNDAPDFFKTLLDISLQRQTHYMNEFISFIRDTPLQRYQHLLKDMPHIIQRVPQHYIASYLGISTVHLSRIKNKLLKK